MVIYLAGEIEEPIKLDELTPRQIVAELDKHVVGQAAAKRAVAVALRNRIRRQKLPPDMALDVMPKNIIMIGSTGVGKTEIARRLARLSSSPFPSRSSLLNSSTHFTELSSSPVPLVTPTPLHSFHRALHVSRPARPSSTPQLLHSFHRPPLFSRPARYSSTPTPLHSYTFKPPRCVRGGRR